MQNRFFLEFFIPKNKYILSDKVYISTIMVFFIKRYLPHIDTKISIQKKFYLMQKSSYETFS